MNLSSDFCSPASSLDALIEKIFKDLRINMTNKEWLCERAILASTNAIVNQLNFKIQKKPTDLPSTIYLSIDQTVDPGQAVHYPTEFLNSLTPSDVPAHLITLKIGSVIILMRNLDPARLCNGTRLVVKGLQRNLIEATILVGTHKGENVLIPRIPMIPSDLIFECKRLQFPIQLAYCHDDKQISGSVIAGSGN